MHYCLRAVILLMQPPKHLRLSKDIYINAAELMVLNIFISHCDTAKFISVHDIIASYLTNGTLVLILFLSRAPCLDAAVALVGRSVPRSALAAVYVCIFFFIRVPN